MVFRAGPATADRRRARLIHLATPRRERSPPRSARDSARRRVQLGEQYLLQPLPHTGLGPVPQPTPADMPELEPSSFGRYSHSIPVCSTYRTRTAHRGPTAATAPAPETPLTLRQQRFQAVPPINPRRALHIKANAQQPYRQTIFRATSHGTQLITRNCLSRDVTATHLPPPPQSRFNPLIPAPCRCRLLRRNSSAGG